MTNLLPVPVALALGSNLGDRFASLRKAVEALASCVEISSASPVYETAPAYVTDQPAFLNAAVIGTTKLEPLPLLWALKNIERDVGRTPTFRYGPRVIDIDIIFYGDTILETPELILPHPRVFERDFVLKPLADIAPSWKHIKLGKTVTEMLAALPSNTLSCLGSLLP
ncbi:MAG TPA: 2-amino-4-hydroxy-6-hydroxymethyldihydropteridine diphosphokinase [Smithella sp.]|nr:2-amino-4-hydroxy-6-hydroxymethyldihydropteridine diphosphokinase [Smithella sp.]